MPEDTIESLRAEVEDLYYQIDALKAESDNRAADSYEDGYQTGYDEGYSEATGSGL